MLISKVCDYCDGFKDYLDDKEALYICHEVVEREFGIKSYLTPKIVVSISDEISGLPTGGDIRRVYPGGNENYWFLSQREDLSLFARYRVYSALGWDLKEVRKGLNSGYCLYFSVLPYKEDDV